MQTTIETTVEEITVPIGIGNIYACDVEIDIDVQPGESMVMYYVDGSGYPGSPPSAEITDFRVITVYWESDDTNDTKGYSSTGKSLCELVAKHLDTTAWVDGIDALDMIQDYCDEPDEPDYDAMLDLHRERNM